MVKQRTVNNKVISGGQDFLKGFSIAVLSFCSSFVTGLLHAKSFSLLDENGNIQATISHDWHVFEILQFTVKFSDQIVMILC